MDCTLQSFAFVTGYTTDFLVKRLGHNGTEKMFPDLEEPYCYRGFNVHELYRVLFDLGWSTTGITKHDVVFNREMKGGPMWIHGKDYIKPYLSEPYYCLSNSNHIIGVKWGEVLDTSDRQIKNPEDFDYQQIHILKRHH